MSNLESNIDMSNTEVTYQYAKKIDKKGLKNLEKLHCPNFPQSRGLRLEKHLQGWMIKTLQL